MALSMITMALRVKQSSNCVSITAGKYIDCVLKIHVWDKPSPHDATLENKAIPLFADIISSFNIEQGSLEDTQEHADLADKQAISYLLLLPIASW